MEAKQGGLTAGPRKNGNSDQGGYPARFKDTWLGKNWGTILILVVSYFIALFVRSYYASPPRWDNGFLVAGGSDSYYHMR